MGKTVNIKMNVAVEMTAATAVSTTAASPTYIDFSGRNLIVFAANSSSSAAANLTIKKGDGIQGVEDLVIPIAAATEIVVRPESGAFKVVSGDNAGKIGFVASASDVSVQVIEIL